MTKKHNHHDADEGEQYAVRRTLAPPSSDMNVTPLIDVLLVLLIIFMATLPMTQRGVDVNLPLETSATTKPEENTQILIEYTANRELTINKRPVALDALEPALRQVFDQRRDRTVFIKGDEALRYGEVIAVIDAAYAVELRVAIVTPAMATEATAKK